MHFSVGHDQPIRVLLADDHPVVRDGIRSWLSAHQHIEVVGEAANGQEALQMTARLEPDVVLMDISMPRLSGLQATRQMRGVSPEARVIILTVHEGREYVIQILRSGARGYLLKDASPDELRHAIEAVASGAVFFSPSVSQTLLDEYRHDAKPLPDRRVPLSTREREVLALVTAGKSNKEVAGALGISVRTVETHRSRMQRKLGIRSIAALTRYAIAQGIVDLT